VFSQVGQNMPRATSFTWSSVMPLSWAWAMGCAKTMNKKAKIRVRKIGRLFSAII
jgi:hypothetical protein